MKKLFLLISSAALALTACGPEDTQSKETKLTVTPESLSFGSSENSPRTITVTAENTEWEYEIVKPNDTWISAQETSEGLSVTVSDNTDKESRSGEIKIRTTGGDQVRSRSVAISQSGTTDKLASYKFEADKSELAFSGEDNQPQTITVTAEGDDLTWTCALDNVSREWITADVVNDKITVTVLDNPKYTERSGKLTITPSIEDLDKITVIVTQAASSREAYLRVDKEELNFKGNDKEPQTITVERFGTEWMLSMENEDGGGVDWFTPLEDKTANTIQVTVNRNTALSPRKGYITLSGDNVDPVKITINQEAGEESLSTLLEDIELKTEMFAGNSRLIVYADQPEEQMYTNWYVELYSEGISKNEQGDWQGNGDLLVLSIYSERVTGDGYNYIPATVYNVDDYEEFTDDGNILYHYPTVFAGTIGYADMLANSYYMHLENNVSTQEAPITGGSMTVSHEDDVYLLEFDFEDDARNKITGSFNDTFKEVHIFDNDPI